MAFVSPLKVLKVIPVDGVYHFISENDLPFRETTHFVGALRKEKKNLESLNQLLN